MKFVLAAALSLLVPGQIVPATVPQTVVPPQAILQVTCYAGDGVWMGSAFRVGSGVFVSVNHVTADGKCFIDAQPISIWYASPNSDFSMLHGNSGPFLKVDCGGFVKGRHYIAIGYGRGAPFETSVDLIGTGRTQSGMAVLEGMLAVIPGMSGGPVIDADTGAVVGTTNAENFEKGLSWSVPLSETPVCKKPVA